MGKVVQAWKTPVSSDVCVKVEDPCILRCVCKSGRPLYPQMCVCMTLIAVCGEVRI